MAVQSPTNRQSRTLLNFVSDMCHIKCIKIWSDIIIIDTDFLKTTDFWWTAIHRIRRYSQFLNSRFKPIWTFGLSGFKCLKLWFYLNRTKYYILHEIDKVITDLRVRRQISKAPLHLHVFAFRWTYNFTLVPSKIRKWMICLMKNTN